MSFLTDLQWRHLGGGIASPKIQILPFASPKEVKKEVKIMKTGKKWEIYETNFKAAQIRREKWLGGGGRGKKFLIPKDWLKWCHYHITLSYKFTFLEKPFQVFYPQCDLKIISDLKIIIIFKIHSS